ncbi:hypothetical protein Ancab_033842 [Ancistrocladus abbreviatus]
MGMIGGGAPATVRFLAGWRLLRGNDYRSPNNNVEFPDEFTVSLSDTVFGFLEEGQGTMKSSSGISEGCHEGIDISDEEEEEEEDCADRVEANKAFWDTQNKLLQETLCKTSSLEKRIRSAAKEALKEAQKEGNFCGCRKPVTAGTCRSCLMREMSSRLRTAGYDSAVCKTKWRCSPDIPAGEHTFLDVIDNSNAKKGQVKMIIELNFRAEFEIGRASEDYKQLISQLPEVFVGKVERLRALIKILCSAAKKCMKDRKMHMGPWRKQKYMQAKWFGPCKRMESITPTLAQGLPNQPSKSRASNSLLTVALLDMMPNTHLKTVAVG